MSIKDTFPIPSDMLEQLPTPDASHFRLGGDFLAIFREFVKCKAPNGEHVTWGSPERVSLPLDELERLMQRVAIAGAQQYIDKMKHEAWHCESFAGWPGNIVDPGTPTIPRGYEVYETPGGYGWRLLSEPRDERRDTPYRDSDSYEMVVGMCWKHALARWDDEQKRLYKCGTSKSKAAHAFLEEFFQLAMTEKRNKITLGDMVTINGRIARIYGVKSLRQEDIQFLGKVIGHLSTFDWPSHMSLTERINGIDDAAKTYASSCVNQFVSGMSERDVEGVPA